MPPFITTWHHHRFGAPFFPPKKRPQARNRLKTKGIQADSCPPGICPHRSTDMQPTINTETPTDSSPATDLIDEISFLWFSIGQKTLLPFLPKHCYNILVGDCCSYIFISSFGWPNFHGFFFFTKDFNKKTPPSPRQPTHRVLGRNSVMLTGSGTSGSWRISWAFSLGKKTGIFWTKHILNSIQIEVIQLPVELFDRVFLEASFCGSAGISLTPGCFECLGDGMRMDERSFQRCLCWVQVFFWRWWLILIDQLEEAPHGTQQFFWLPRPQSMSLGGG